MTDKEREKKTKKLLGEMLLDAGLIDEMQLAVALGQQRQRESRLGSQLLRLGFVAERELAEILREQLGIQWISLFDSEIPREVLDAVPVETAMKYTVMPVAYDKSTITLASTNPSDLETLDSLTFQLGKKIKPLMALESDIERAIIKHYKFKDQDYPKKVKEKLMQLSSAVQQHMKTQITSRKELILEPGANPEAKDTSQKTNLDTSQKTGTRASVTAHNRSFSQQALINLLIKKNIITKNELLNEIMELERSSLDE
jgi:hypothetical protein